MAEESEPALDPSLLIEEETPKEEPPKQEEQAPEPEQEVQVPDKYKGKTALEIIKMHQDAERLIGKQGNEVGELREIVNDILSAQTAEPSTAPDDPDVSFFEDPDRATDSRIRKTLAPTETKLQQIEQRLAQQDQRESAQELLRRHPDVAKITASPEFGEWIGKSKVRLKMFEQAHSNYDTEMASELIDLWKERQQTKKESSKAAKDTRTEAVKQAATGGGKASSESRGKPILSREAVIELKRTNPDKYASLLPQLKQAYREGRVR